MSWTRETSSLSFSIRRVLMDVMWARQPNTVAANWSRSKRDFDMAVDNLSLDYHIPVLGNRVGLGVALKMVLASLRPGKNGPHVQFDTIQKTQTWYANAYDAGENFSCKTVVGLDQKKQYVSTGHTFGKWFLHFMWGAHLHMGVVGRQNEALSSKLVIGICAEAENLWTQARTDTKRLEMEDAVCFMLIAFGVGLQGKEVPLVSLEGLLQLWQETCKGPTGERYMMMTLSGWFKGEVDSRGVWCPSVIGPTPTYPSIYGWRGSCIEGSTTSIALRVGCSRPVQVHGQSSERYDAMFWTLVTLARGTNSRLVPGAIEPDDISLWHSPRALRVGCSRPVQVHGQSSERYDAMFWTLVTLARGTNSRLVPDAIEPDDISLWHSPRRGAVLETTQRGVDSKVMELVNRWRSKEGVKGSVPNLLMLQVYTQVRSTLPTMLKYSCAI